LLSTSLVGEKQAVPAKQRKLAVLSQEACRDTLFWKPRERTKLRIASVQSRQVLCPMGSNQRNSSYPQHGDLLQPAHEDYDAPPPQR
jgi:hypothetical protein